MKRNERRIILALIYTGIMLACCVSGIIALGRDQVGAGAVLMATMFAMAWPTDRIYANLWEEEKEYGKLTVLEDEE